MSSCKKEFHNLNNRFLFYKGRVALYALLKAFGIAAGDRVLLPGYTCVVVPLAVHYLKAIPEYADVSIESYNARLSNYEAAYQRIWKNGFAHTLKGIIIQHTYGNPNSETSAIVAWARQKGLFVIEDCAHVNGVTINGHPAGNFGDGAFFSTQWSKPFTTGLGGIAQLNKPEYVSAMHEIISYACAPGMYETLFLALQLTAHKLLLNPRLYWFAINTHRTLAKAGIFVGSSTTGELNGQMPQDYYKVMGFLQKWLLARRESNMEAVNTYRKWLVVEYDKGLAQNGLSTFKREADAVLIRYPVRVTDKAACLKAAKANRIELGDWFDQPLHPAGSNLAGLNWDDNFCPNAVKLAYETINLPVHLQINTVEVKRGVNFVSSYMRNQENRSEMNEQFSTVRFAGYRRRGNCRGS